MDEATIILSRALVEAADREGRRLRDPRIYDAARQPLPYDAAPPKATPSP